MLPLGAGDDNSHPLQRFSSMAHVKVARRRLAILSAKLRSHMHHPPAPNSDPQHPIRAIEALSGSLSGCGL